MKIDCTLVVMSHTELCWYYIDGNKEIGSMRDETGHNITCSRASVLFIFALYYYMVKHSKFLYLISSHTEHTENKSYHQDFLFDQDNYLLLYCTDYTLPTKT